MFKEKPQLSIKAIEKLIHDVPDFPKPGIVFKDITPILEEAHAFKSLTQHFVDVVGPLKKRDDDCLLAVESRGFLFACAMAPLLDMGVVLARKPGKLPRETASHTYELEYGSDTIEIHKSSLKENQGVFIVDDVLATGGTAQAVETVAEDLGAYVRASVFFMELGFLNGREKLNSDVHSLLSY